MSPTRKKQVQDEAAAPAPAPLPLNRKYRPQSFDSDELVGQEHIVRTLRNAIRSNRIAPAYLFCGPRGTGKTSTARIMAKAVNCLDPDPDKRPCNQCAACVAINSGATTDVIEIDAASNRGIDDIRDLRDRVNYAPTQLKTKFYIIDEAHQITGAAANAFLKTLEEPPAHTRFILATTDPEELLPTIVSRCQRFDFRRHTPEIIARRIEVLAEREGIKLAKDALALIADLAHGSMRDPIGLLDQLSNYQAVSGTELSAEDVRALVGISHSEIAVRVLVAISEGDAKAALQAINEAVTAGQDPRQLNRQIVSLIRDGLYIASGARSSVDEQQLKDASERLGLTGLLHVATAFADTDSGIRSAVIPQLPLEMAVLDAIIGPARSAQRRCHRTACVQRPRRYSPPHVRKLGRLSRQPLLDRRLVSRSPHVRPRRLLSQRRVSRRLFATGIEERVGQTLTHPRAIPASSNLRLLRTTTDLRLPHQATLVSRCWSISGPGFEPMSSRWTAASKR